MEGIDGSGKSTMVAGLRRKLEEKGYGVEVTKEPTDGPIGKYIRQVLRGEKELGHAELQLMFTADRAHHHNEMIDPAIESGKHVITDRHALSTISYGAAMGLDQEWLENCNAPFLEKVDFGLYIDLRPEIAMERRARSGTKLELFEKLPLLQKIHAAYKRSLENPRINPPSRPKWYVVDGTLGPEELVGKTYEIVRQRL